MDKKQTIAGKVALITGASSGIGKAVAFKLADEGCDVVLVARDENKLIQVEDQISSEHEDIRVLSISTDIRYGERVIEAVQRCLDEFGQLDILVNNAGIIRYDELESFSDDDFDDVMRTNVYGTFFMTKAALPHLRNTKGNLIFIGSFDANHPRSFNPVYCASKWWVKGFAHSVESIVGKDGVAVTLINPSEVRTAIADESGQAYIDRFEKGEVSEPEEVADAVLFAVKQSSTTTISQLDLYRRDKLSDFF